MSVNCLFLGSNIANWRPLRFTGNNFADNKLDPSLQYAGFSGGRITDVSHTRPFSSNIGLWILVRLSQIASSPQYGEGFSGGGGPSVFGLRTGAFTKLA